MSNLSNFVLPEQPISDHGYLAGQPEPDVFHTLQQTSGSLYKNVSRNKDKDFVSCWKGNKLTMVGLG